MESIKISPERLDVKLTNDRPARDIYGLLFNDGEKIAKRISSTIAELGRSNRK